MTPDMPGTIVLFVVMALVGITPHFISKKSKKGGANNASRKERE